MVAVWELPADIPARMVADVQRSLFKTGPRRELLLLKIFTNDVGGMLIVDRQKIRAGLKPSLRNTAYPEQPLIPPRERGNRLNCMKKN